MIVSVGWSGISHHKQLGEQQADPIEKWIWILVAMANKNACEEREFLRWVFSDDFLLGVGRVGLWRCVGALHVEAKNAVLIFSQE